MAQPHALEEKEFQEPPSGWRTLLIFGVGTVGAIAAIILWLLILIAFLWAIWWLYLSMTGVHGEKVEAPPPQAVNMLPPPPPPPPPPPQPPKPEQPTESAKPEPSEPAAPKQDAPAPMTQNAPAQAGSDSYGLASGSGSGSGAPGGTGTCVGANCGAPAAGGISDSFYARALASALQQRVQADKRVNRDIFQADFAVWISPDGRVTRAEIIKGSSDAKRDQVLHDLIVSATGLTAPPASFKFPRRISVSGKKAI